jgi:CMP-N-acetylneuraminic acid synthetase
MEHLMKDVISFIFARGGSKGLKNKNILSFAGKPLIAWTIEQAQGHPDIDRVLVSTDSLEIAEISKSFGAEVPFIRPPELATDSSSELSSWKHALNFLKKEEGKFPEIFVSLPCTAPLRSQDDITRNLHLLVESGGDLALTVTPSQRSPYFNMVHLQSDSRASVVIDNGSSYTRRQDAPHTYDMTTVAYSAKSNYILETNELLSGKVYATIVDQERAIDIDNSFDFEIAEYLFKKSGKK